MSIDPTGYTLAHEHLHIDLSGFKNNVDCRLDQYAFICQEMNDLMTRGVRNVIEMTNRYMGRNAQFMLDVMRETGINVVACTGYYQDAFFPEHVATRSVQELAQEMVDEIEQGIDGTDLKAGIIAEIGSSEGKITPLEEKVFIDSSWIPLSRYPDFDEIYVEGSSTYQLFQERFDTRVVSDKKTIDIFAATRPQAKWLKCELGEPLFRISKIAFDQNDKPVHVSELFCRANRITLTIDNKRH
jgi:hypothetical protein